VSAEQQSGNGARVAAMPTLIMAQAGSAGNGDSLVAFASLSIGGSGPIGEWWREFVLIAVPPALGAAHLMSIGAHASKRPAALN